jgi:2,3-bisphosphoglycerate-independent phosphoglycerate mutase
MSPRQQLLQRLALVTDSRIVLLVLDGVGDLRTPSQPRTPLEMAHTPHLDRLAASAALGRIVPATLGVTPGSGPGHLALFGHDPTEPENDIGRGVLEALGLGLELTPDTLAARGNFATVDEAGHLTDRRAGRIPTEECRRLVEKMRARLAATPPEGLDVEVHAGEGYRFVLLLRDTRGATLSADLEETDPQRLGEPPRPLAGTSPQGRETAERLAPVLGSLRAALEGEERANAFLLRGFARPPSLPSFEQLYGLRGGAFAGYPLYRGVASVCGMEVVESGKSPDELFARAREHWDRFRFFFIHVKATDAAGEDGNAAQKAAEIERVDRALPSLLELRPDVVAITGDHSTPAPMRAHSWHPVPLLVSSPTCFVDDTTRYTELEAARGALGTFPAHELLGLLLAHAGKLQKFGA